MQLKRILFIALLLCGRAFAQSLYQPGTLATSLNAVSTTGAGTVFALPPVEQSFFNLHTWTVTVSSQPPSITVNLEGSLDGTNYFTLSTIASTDATWVSGEGEMVHVSYKPVRFMRCNVSAFTPNGATATCDFISGRQ